MVKPDAPTDGGTGKWAWHTWLHDHVVVPLPDGAEVASKDYVDNSANFAVIIRGTLASTADLPNNAEPGDGWVVDGVLWVWNGTEWLDLGTFQGETGPVGMVWQGPWDATVAYAADDAVSHGGQSWIATAATAAGDEPGVAAAWDVLAAQGDTGLQGEQGVKGDTGDQGLVWRGDWVSTTAYVAQDGVAYGGESWIATAASTGVTPSDAAVEWDLLAKAGTDGQGVPATVLSPTVTAPSQAGVVGASTDFARQDHEHPSDEFLTPAAGNAAYSPAGFRAHRSTLQPLSASTPTKIIFDTEVVDDGGDYDPSTGVWTVPEDDWYDVATAVDFDNLADGELALVEIYVNGVGHSRLASYPAGAASDGLLGGSRPLKLSAGDTVAIYALRGNAENVRPASALTYFTAKKG